MTELPTERFRTRSEVADLLGVSEQTLRDWERAGTGPEVMRLSAKIARYPAGAVSRFLSDSKRSAGRNHAGRAMMSPANAAWEAQQRANAERLAIHNEKLAVWRAENRRRQGLPPLPPYVPANPERAPLAHPVAPKPASVPLAPKPAPARLAPQSAADREFDAVASAALARIEAQAKLRRDEDSAVAAILAATL